MQQASSSNICFVASGIESVFTHVLHFVDKTSTCTVPAHREACITTERCDSLRSSKDPVS